MENKNSICKNCEQEFLGEYQFCPYCGQKSKDKLSMSVLFYNTISNYFSFDARFFKSFIPLMFRPGFLAKQFVEGKRLRYLHPAQFYLFASVVFFFLFSFQVREYNQKVDTVLKKGLEGGAVMKFDTITKKTLDSISIKNLTQPLNDKQFITDIKANEFVELDSIINETSKENMLQTLHIGFDKKKLDSLVASGASEADQLKAIGMNDDAGFLQRRFFTQMLKFLKNSGGGILQAFSDSIPLALFVLLPIFAFILKLFFWRKGSFSHHLVFSFYYFSFLFTVFSINSLLNFIWKVPNWIEWVFVLYICIYLLIAVKQFYRQGYFLSFMKTGTVVFIYCLFVVPIAIIIMSVSSFLFY